ncbi:MAG: ATP-binding cassette domain-containing protein, partial [Bacteroidales bacterium]
MLEITNASKTFFPGTVNEVKALQRVNLSVDNGSFTAIIGTNGSGKSTLLNAIAGTFIPDEGVVRVDGNDITRWKEYQRARLIGRVFQNPFAGTAAEMTIAENIVMAMRRGQMRSLKTAVTGTVKEEIAD